MFVIIGTTTADILLQTSLPAIFNEDDGFREGNLIFTEYPPKILLGGNGGNTAYVLSKLGATVALISAVGQDVLGDFLIDCLKEQHVNISNLIRSDIRSTSTSTILMSDTSHQLIFHHLGASQDVRPIPTQEKMFTQADVLLITGYSLLHAMRYEGYANALRIVHQQGGLTAVDIGPAIGEYATLSELKGLLSDIDFLIANTHELCVFTGDTAWETAAERTLAAGAHNIIIKHGAKGVFAWTPDLQIQVPAFSVNATITVGAGDSFNAGLLYGIQNGRTLKESLFLGSAVAALVVSGENGVLGAPDMNQVTRFLQQDHSG